MPNQARLNLNHCLADLEVLQGRHRWGSGEHGGGHGLQRHYTSRSSYVHAGEASSNGSENAPPLTARASEHRQL
eukprot:241825-Rhodomonas_salina.1